MSHFISNSYQYHPPCLTHRYPAQNIILVNIVGKRSRKCALEQSAMTLGSRIQDTTGKEFLAVFIVEINQNIDTDCLTSCDKQREREKKRKREREKERKREREKERKREREKERKREREKERNRERIETEAKRSKTKRQREWTPGIRTRKLC